MSAAHAASSSQLPGTPKPLAEDSYTEQSGTSMVCPAVAGLVAVILQISEEEGLTFDPAEVKELLRENSEPKGEASEPDISDTWNEKYGFGIIDGNLFYPPFWEKAEAIQEAGIQQNHPPGEGDWLVYERPIRFLVGRR